MFRVTELDLSKSPLQRIDRHAPRAAQRRERFFGRSLGLAAIALAASLVAAIPARADDDDQGEHRGWHHGHRGEVVVVPRPAPVYVVPQPYYYAPPPVVYAPPVIYAPPVVYAPPAVYSDPSINLVFPIHVR